LIKYDADLNVLWHKVIKAGSSIFSICSDREDGVYFAGSFGRDFIVIDGDTLINANNGGTSHIKHLLKNISQKNISHLAKKHLT
jgi:hypothetical protein